MKAAPLAHANAVKTLGLGDKVAFFGTDMNNQMGQMLQAGRQHPARCHRSGPLPDGL